MFEKKICPFCGATEDYIEKVDSFKYKCKVCGNVFKNVDFAYSKFLDFTDDIELQKKASKFGLVYLGYHVPVQIWKPDDDGDGHIVLYMPRKEECESISLNEFFADIEGGASDENINDLCEVSAAILKNLARMMTELKDNKRNYVYYPNEE